MNGESERCRRTFVASVSVAVGQYKCRRASTRELISSDSDLYPSDSPNHDCPLTDSVRTTSKIIISRHIPVLKL